MTIERMKELSATISECDLFIRSTMMWNMPLNPIELAKRSLELEIQFERKETATNELKRLVKEHVANGGTLEGI